ncbi:MAG: hypothetical protein ABI408_06300 [Gemmatimonadaceae bacterium]
MSGSVRLGLPALVVTAACALTVAACSGKPDTSSTDSLSASSTASSTSAVNPDAPLTVRGTVASISATSIVVKTDTGKVTVALTAPFQVYSRAPGKLTDVKDNTFIGVTTVKQPDGAERATEIHIFPEDLRGMGEGSRMMTQSMGSAASRMTNGAVTSGTGAQSRMSNGAVAKASDSTLVVQYAGGSTTVTVPRNTPVTDLKATSRSLKAGDQVVLVAKKEADGSLSSSKALIAGK